MSILPPSPHEDYVNITTLILLNTFLQIFTWNVCVMHKGNIARIILTSFVLGVCKIKVTLKKKTFFYNELHHLVRHNSLVLYGNNQFICTWKNESKDISSIIPTFFNLFINSCVTSSLEQYEMELLIDDQSIQMQTLMQKFTVTLNKKDDQITEYRR